VRQSALLRCHEVGCRNDRLFGQLDEPREGEIEAGEQFLSRLTGAVVPLEPAAQQRLELRRQRD
jgi:hypothetical protein